MTPEGSQILVEPVRSTTPNPVVEAPTVKTGESGTPFIIAVSGHRDLDPQDMARLTAAVAETHRGRKQSSRFMSNFRETTLIPRQ